MRFNSIFVENIGNFQLFFNRFQIEYHNSYGVSSSDKLKGMYNNTMKKSLLSLDGYPLTMTLPIMNNSMFISLLEKPYKICSVALIDTELALYLVRNLNDKI